jgi:hypothetical protein
MKKQLPLWLWTTIVYMNLIIVGILDWMTGYEVSFFVFYFIPILLCSWYMGLAYTTVLSVISALVWSTADILSGHIYTSNLYVVWNTLVRLTSFLMIGWIVYRMKEGFNREKKSAEELRRALSEIKVLEAFLPICAQCKKIRNQQGEWLQMEVYIGQHSNTHFSHGYCPDCAKKAMEEAGLIDKKT